MTFAYYLIRNYSGEMSKLIQKYQGSGKDLLCQFLKVGVLKSTDVVQVPLWSLINFRYFNSFQDEPSEVERRVLVQNNKNILDYIFGRFNLMLWWEDKVIEGSYVYPFKEETYHSKTPLVLSGNLAQIKTNF